VLVVDDDRRIREGVVRQLRDAAMTSEAADDAAGALERLKSGRWDVVLCDLRLLGKEWLRTIRRDHPAVDVLVLTAFGFVDAVAEAIVAGAADYLTKPFAFRELEHRLHKIAELQSLCRAESGPRARLDVDGEPAPRGLEPSAELGTRPLFTVQLEGHDKLPFQHVVRRFENLLLDWAMTRAAGQQSLAAELLGLPRTTLQSKLLKRHGAEQADAPASPARVDVVRPAQNPGGGTGPVSDGGGAGHAVGRSKRRSSQTSRAEW
jgi:DNA-binding NtrC family response regulator